MKPFVDMDGINIQIEPCKTYFSDGCVETEGADETDLLRGAPSETVTTDEPVCIVVISKKILLWFSHFIFKFPD